MSDFDIDNADLHSILKLLDLSFENAQDSSWNDIKKQLTSKFVRCNDCDKDFPLGTKICWECVCDDELETITASGSSDQDSSKPNVIITSTYRESGLTYPAQSGKTIGETLKDIRNKKIEDDQEKLVTDLYDMESVVFGEIIRLCNENVNSGCVIVYKYMHGMYSTPDPRSNKIITAGRDKKVWTTYWTKQNLISLINRLKKENLNAKLTGWFSKKIEISW